MASVERAIGLGADLIEIDVQRTADNVLVLLHDRTINRTTNGRGRLGSLTWAEVQAASGEYPVPMLREVLGVIRPSEAIVALELKHPHLYPGIEAQVLALIDEYEMAERVIIISFDHDSLERVAEIKPEIETGQLYIHGFWMPRAGKTALLEVFWLMPLVEPTFVWRQHRQGRRVWIWTVDNRLLMRLLLWMGVDGITTNYPERWPGSLAI